MPVDQILVVNSAVVLMCFVSWINSPTLKARVINTVCICVNLYTGLWVRLFLTQGTSEIKYMPYNLPELSLMILFGMWGLMILLIKDSADATYTRATEGK